MKFTINRIKIYLLQNSFLTIMNPVFVRELDTYHQQAEFFARILDTTLYEIGHFFVSQLKCHSIKWLGLGKGSR